MPSTGLIVAMPPPRWWVLALLGAISIAVGILAVAYPDITLRVFGIFIGIYLVIAGAAWVAIAVDEEISVGARVLGVIIGFISVLAGMICLVRPSASVLAVLLTVAFWFVMVGVADLARAIAFPQGRWVSAFFGVVAIAVGVILVADPDVGISTVAVIAGIGFILRGMLELAAGIYLRTQT